MTDVAIACMQVIAHDLVAAAQMNIVASMPRVRARPLLLRPRLQLVGVDARSP